MRALARHHCCLQTHTLAHAPQKHTPANTPARVTLGVWVEAIDALAILVQVPNHLRTADILETEVGRAARMRNASGPRHLQASTRFSCNTHTPPPPPTALAET